MFTYCIPDRNYYVLIRISIFALSSLAISASFLLANCEVIKGWCEKVRILIRNTNMHMNQLSNLYRLCIYLQAKVIN